MVGAFSEVQVMDWRLAKVLDAGADDPAAERLALDLGGGSVAELAAAGGALRTMDGTICGTPSYMPPEQANGQVDELDERADIYALGAMLYEMLALRPPYTGETARQILVQVVQANLHRQVRALATKTRRHEGARRSTKGSSASCTFVSWCLRGKGQPRQRARRSILRWSFHPHRLAGAAPGTRPC